jgi:phosphatidate cytidylyltransferase
MEKNLKLRVITGVVCGPLIFFSAIFWKYVFALFIFLLLILALKEFFSLMDKMNIKSYRIYGYLFGSLIFIDMLFLSGEHFFLVFLVFIISLSPMIFLRKSEYVFYETSGTFFGTLYFSICITVILLIIQDVDKIVLQSYSGGKIASLILLSVWTIDISAFFGGRKFGRHSFFHSVSPNKTLEGAIMGFLGAVVISIIAKYIYINFLSFWGALGMGILIGIFGQIGDLIESALKRRAGVKDSSNIVPGHGGVLDRFDSFIFSCPVCYIFIKYFLFI